jgi:hypothetical protein
MCFPFTSTEILIHRQDWPIHKAACKKPKAAMPFSPLGMIYDPASGRATPASNNALFFAPMFYSAETPESVYLELVNAYRLLRLGSSFSTAMGESNRPPSSMPFSEWMDRVERATILPDWWDKQANSQGLLKYSQEDEWGRLDRHVSVDDIRQKTSPPGRFMVLEMMTERVMNNS